MISEIEKSIETLVKMISSGMEYKSDDALKLTQAALNLAHTRASIIVNTLKEET